MLVPPIADLNRKLRYPVIQETLNLVKQISRSIIPAPISFKSTLTENVEDEEEVSSGGGWVSTGDMALDEALGGGLRVGTITELSGERLAEIFRVGHTLTRSASGKSHFCLMTALAAQIPALTTRPGGTLILTSEREISTDRLYGLGEFLLAAHEPRGRLAPSDLLDHILSHSVENITLLEHALNYKLPHILRARNGLSQTQHAANGAAGKARLLVKPIRLLIIDSITALIRGAEGNYANSTSMGLTERSRHLCAVADRLKHLATEFGLAVLVINQVSDVFARPPVQSSTPTAPSSSQMLSQFYTDGPEPPMLYATQSRWFSGQTATLQKEASLGIVWANAVNVRVMLSQTKRRRHLGVQDLKRKKRKPNGTHVGAQPDEEPDTVDPVIDDTARTLIRRAQVVFSPFVPPATVDFVITETGIHSLPDSYRLVDVAEMARRRGRIARALMMEKGDDDDTSLPSRSSQLPQETQTILYGADEEGLSDDEQHAAELHGSDDYDELGPIPDDLWDTIGSKVGGRAGEVEL